MKDSGYDWPEYREACYLECENCKGTGRLIRCMECGELVPSKNILTVVYAHWEQSLDEQLDKGSQQWARVCSEKCAKKFIEDAYHQ